MLSVLMCFYLLVLVRQIGKAIATEIEEKSLKCAVRVLNDYQAALNGERDALIEAGKVLEPVCYYFVCNNRSCFLPPQSCFIYPSYSLTSGMAVPGKS